MEWQLIGLFYERPTFREPELTLLSAFTDEYDAKFEFLRLSERDKHITYSLRPVMVRMSA
jgi:hypothetical protein